MRLISFSDGDRGGVGLMREGDAFIDLASLDSAAGSMRQLLCLDAGRRRGLLEQASRCGATRRLRDVALEPVVPDPQAIWALALNFTTHIDEGNHQRPAHPVLFLRLPASLTGHDRELLKPQCTSQYDYEGELAVIIGTAGRNVSRERALDHIAGYTCCNEGSVREWQKHTSQITPGKNFAASGSLGPWLVTADELTDPYEHTLVTRVNGREVQRARLGDMLFRLEEIIAYISIVTPLVPGDVILMGTPGGVGFRRDPQLFLGEGDEVEVEIGGIGILRNRVVEVSR